MTTPTIDTPDTTPAPSDPTGPRDRYVHLYCCNPDLSLCGANLSNGVERTTPANCPMCEVIDDLDEPCGITCRGAA